MRVSTSPASRAFIVCCALVAKCTGVAVPSRHGSQGRRAPILPLAPARSGAWDVTFLPSQVQGRWFYLYLILDLYSRKIVGFEVHDTDTAEHAAHLTRR